MRNVLETIGCCNPGSKKQEEKSRFSFLQAGHKEHSFCLCLCHRCLWPRRPCSLAPIQGPNSLIHSLHRRTEGVPEIVMKPAVMLVLWEAFLRAQLSFSGPKCQALQGPGSPFSHLGPKALLRPQWSEGGGRAFWCMMGCSWKCKGFGSHVWNMYPVHWGLIYATTESFPVLLFILGRNLKQKLIVSLNVK